MSTFKDRRPWGRMFENQLPEFLDLVVAEPEQGDQADAEFVLEMVKHCNAELRGQGLQCIFMGPNVTNQGYRLCFIDSERRRFYSGFTFDEGITLAENNPGQGFQELLKLVCERTLLARELQFEQARANSTLTLSEVVQENTPSN